MDAQETRPGPEKEAATHSRTERWHSVLKLRLTWTQLVVGLFAALVGFSAVSQFRQDDAAALDNLRQADLVRLLDEISTRVTDLSAERDALRLELAELESGVTSREAAQAAAEAEVTARSIQAGVVPVQGPGVVVTTTDPEGAVRAQLLVGMIEELRNAGAEAIEINSVRVGTDTWIVQDDRGVKADGLRITSPYTVRAIGDGDGLSVALSMPGGILAQIRAVGASTEVVTQDVVIESVRTLRELEFATVVD